VDTFTLIPVGNVVVDANIYQVMVTYMVEYFIIGFRIALPMYASILIVDTILGILAKVAPQMNMFAVGIQLKIAVGLLVLFFMVRLLPGVSTMIYEEMVKLLRLSVSYLGGG
ncbi:MAG: flagellar biosynthetic protein FliR, partial [Lachnospiraceae bacterium]|nr:flagellar biosynthetic protein FliR [Lachnospiraceae bacterium]